MGTPGLLFVLRLRKGGLAYELASVVYSIVWFSCPCSQWWSPMTTWTLRTLPSSSGYRSVTCPSSHLFLGRFSSFTSTSSTCMFRLGLFHCWRGCSDCRYSFLHLLQNSFAKYCIRHQGFLEYMSGLSKVPGGGNTILLFMVRSLYGVSGDTSGELELSLVNGQLSSMTRRPAAYLDVRAGRSIRSSRIVSVIPTRRPCGLHVERSFLGQPSHSYPSARRLWSSGCRALPRPSEVHSRPQWNWCSGRNVVGVPVHGVRQTFSRRSWTSLHPCCWTPRCVWLWRPYK